MFFQHSVISQVSKFEVDTINALRGDNICSGSKIGAKFYFDALIMDFLLDLGQECQCMICRSGWDE